MNFPTCSTCKWIFKKENQYSICNMPTQYPPGNVAGSLIVKNLDIFGCHSHEDKDGNRWVNFGIPEKSEIREIKPIETETDPVLLARYTTVIKKDFE